GGGGGGAGRAAAGPVLALWTRKERAQSQGGRSQLAREHTIPTADVWVPGPGGMPQARRLQLGITDGLTTEIVTGDLHKDDRVIVGAEAETARPAGLAGL